MIDPVILEATCPYCGRRRTVRAWRPSVAERAVTRPCRSCANRQAAAGRLGHASRDFGEFKASGPRETEAKASLAACRNYQIDESEVDWVTVDRIISGQLSARGQYRTETLPDRLAAVAILTARGRSAPWIAQRTGMSSRTVARLRTRLRMEIGKVA